MAKSNINSIICMHETSEICLGDIVKDIKVIELDENGNTKEIIFPFMIVISQSCDLEQGLKILLSEESPLNKSQKEKIQVREFNQFLPNIILLPLFNSEELKQGQHLITPYKIVSKPLGGDLWKKIKSNKDARFHYIDSISIGDITVPDSLIDFKIYYSYPFELLVKNYGSHYQVSLNELFRESLSQRFTNYLNRIGLPKIE